ncbi:MAG: efflux RND transporter periplasmic adaptor subunit [Synergistes sp.]|nr:efflux RND transporter periplasmic adaptor subunit [Synergistes sp.]
MGTSKKIIIIAVLVVLAAIGGWFIYFEEKPQEGKIRASGTVEVTEVLLAPQAGGRIEELNIDNADHVKKGQLIARLSLDGADYDVKMAKKALEAAKSQLEELRNGYRKEDIARAKAELEVKKVQHDQAKRDEIRFKKLAAEGVVSKREGEVAEEASRSSANAVIAATEAVRRLENGPRYEEIAAAQANVDRAEAAYQKAVTLIGYKEFYAPADGIILSKNFEVGDVISVGTPIAMLGDMTDCWVKLYIPSTQLGLVRLGDKCKVFVDAYPGKAFAAKVTQVNQEAEYNPRLSLTQSERANMVFWIKVSVEDSEGIIKPGMPADVIVE